MRIDFSYSLNSKVWINDIETYGVVRIVRYSGDGPEFFVSYWIDSKRYTEWLSPDELASEKP